MPKANDSQLLFVSKGTKERLNILSFGVSLERKTGYSILALRSKVVGDRLELARFILKNAERALTHGNLSYRTAVSRAYYSMYHTIRALSYYSNGGDDFEDHARLPGSIPDDFPSRARWENKLKQARLDRNRADYDPYPKSDKKFQSAAQDLVQNARELMPEVRRYLKSKGWPA